MNKVPLNKQCKPQPVLPETVNKEMLPETNLNKRTTATKKPRRHRKPPPPPVETFNNEQLSSSLGTEMHSNKQKSGGTKKVSSRRQRRQSLPETVRPSKEQTSYLETEVKKVSINKQRIVVKQVQVIKQQIIKQSPQPETVNEEQLPYLETEYIYPLRKKSTRFEKAIYFCRLCDHHLNTFDLAKAHISANDHKNAKEEKALVSLLASIPKPSSSHCLALNEVLKSAIKLCARSNEELEKCEQILDILNTLFRQRIHKDCYVRMYGSCASGFALKSSNLNLELMYPEGDPSINHAKALMKAGNLLYEIKNLFTDVRKDFCHKWPHVRFTINVDYMPRLNVVLSVRNTQAFEISQLFKIYTECFPCLKVMGQIWRFWAKMCEVDNFQNGGLPVYAFDLMLVHYLQQCQPAYLPILHEIEMTDEERKVKLYQNDVETIKKWPQPTTSEWNYGEIFLGLLRYYTVGSDNQYSVINVRSKTELSRDAKGWNKKRLAIEDPFMPNKNIAQLSPDMYAYFTKCLQNSYKYFGIPQTSAGPLFTYVDRKLVLNCCGDALKHQKIGTNQNSNNISSSCRRNSAENNFPTTKEQQRPYEIVFNTNARNVPVDRRVVDNKELVISLTEKADGSCLVVKKQNEEENIEKEIKNDVSVLCTDLVNKIVDEEKLEKKNAEHKRSVRNFCVKRLKEMKNDEKVDNNHMIYDRKSLLEIAKVYQDDLQWPDLSKLDEYRTLLELPRSLINKRFNTDKFGWKQISDILKSAEDCFSKNNNLSNDDCVQKKCEEEKKFEDEKKFLGENNDCSVQNRICFQGGSNENFSNRGENDLNDTSPERQIVIGSLLAETPCESDVGYESFGQPEDLAGFVGEKLVEKFLLADEKEILREIDESRLNSKSERSFDSCSDDSVEFRENDVEVLDSDVDDVNLELTPPADEIRRSTGVVSPKVRLFNDVRVDLELVLAADNLNLQDFTFKFELRKFQNDLSKPVVFCDSCGEIGHLTVYCTNLEKELHPLKPLPPLTLNYLQLQSFVGQQIFENYKISHGRVSFQERFRHDLEIRLQTLWPDAQLFLFGSSCNGFGFNHSDLDLCLIFANQQTLSKETDPVKVIRQIAKLLTKEHGFCDILPVTRAKVPIVRFYHREHRLEGDISLYNILALRNTKLLYMYSLIDRRAQILGYMAKVFAKHCDIGDASKGSLSSYAYILMVIHFLQRTNPPVLPILQQIYVDPRQVHSYRVEDWETYFYSDINNLPYVWKGYHRNKETVGELWVGFLKYYTEKFDPRNDVVQIRQSQPLSKFEKLWTDRAMAIEDPFELSHNLASGLSKKMFVYIMKAFRRGREVFGDPLQEKLIYTKFSPTQLHYDTLMYYFFGVALKFSEPPPKDRVCKLCERVGHFVENCPQKRSNRGKLMQELMAEVDDDVRMV